MATPHEKLADALEVLRHLQASGRRVFQSGEFSRTNRERLLKNGFLQEVIQGWLISSSPGTREGDSTPWYASFWEFCARYCTQRFEEQWHFSPDQSLLLYAENSVIPSQIIIYATKGTNNQISLLFGTSLYDLKKPKMPVATHVVAQDGLRIYTPAAALARITADFYTRYPVEAQIALNSIKDSSDILRCLLEEGRSHVAGRVVGAFRHIDRADIADEIAATMKAAGYDIRESNPFTLPPVLNPKRTANAPIVPRIQGFWRSMREIVIDTFPKAPGIPDSIEAYLRNVDEIYKSDAYHSLSIEGYTVTLALIERVRSGDWNPDGHEEDRESRDALAARGYWQAFQRVKRSLSEILTGAPAGSLVRAAHRDWYRELFQPCVAAGLIEASALAGYRNDAVYLRTSRYVPPRWEAVRDAMPELFSLLEEESEPSVRAVLGHWLFGYIHPYPDGNGRMARFVMNAMLASGGYPWTIVRIEDRASYLEALDKASIDGNVQPFAQLMAERVQSAIEQAGAVKA
jgi:fido (protein-threonine AMPylation protein)